MWLGVKMNPADADEIILDVCQFELLDPGLIGSVGKTVFHTDMFLDLLPVFADDRVVFFLNTVLFH